MSLLDPAEDGDPGMQLCYSWMNGLHVMPRLVRMRGALKCRVSCPRTVGRATVVSLISAAWELVALDAKHGSEWEGEEQPRAKKNSEPTAAADTLTCRQTLTDKCLQSRPAPSSSRLVDSHHPCALLGNEERGGGDQSRK